MIEVAEVYGNHKGKRYPFPASFEKLEQWVRDNAYTLEVEELKELARIFENLSIYPETYATIKETIRLEIENRKSN